MNKAKKEIEKLKKKVPKEPIVIQSGKEFYANTKHPYWKGKEGNPYLPLDKNGDMRKGYVG